MKNLMEYRKKNETAGEIFRYWRKLKRISQLDLALDIGISAKHLSFVESGKSLPSRNLILNIANSLKLPLRHRNAVLKAAGYSPEFGEEPLNGQRMEIVRQALHRMIGQHEPYPAFVVDASYKLLMLNSGFEKIVKYYLGEYALEKYDNVYRITFAKDGLRQYIQGWPFIEHFMIGRLWEEMVSSQNKELFELYSDISQMKTTQEAIDFQVDCSLPVMSLTLEKDSIRTSYFTTITTFGTPLDMTTQELRIEFLFPADEETKNFLIA